MPVDGDEHVRGPAELRRRLERVDQDEAVRRVDRDRADLLLPVVVPGRPAAQAGSDLLHGQAATGSPRGASTSRRNWPGEGALGLGDLLGRAGRDQLAARLAALGAEVDHPVGLLDHVEVVLDHEHRVAGVDEPLQHLEQLLDVGEVEPGRRLVEDVERPAGRHLAELRGQLDALRLAAGERRRRLAELDVVEADVVQRLQAPAQLRDLGEELERLLDRHLEHVGDRLALEAHLERLLVVAVPVAGLARHVDVGQEVHLDLDRAVALAGLAAAAADVEGEAPGLVAAHLRLGRQRVELADVREQVDVGGRVRARRAADRLLVDVDHLVEDVDPLHRGVLARLDPHPVEPVRERLVDDLVDERRLAGAGDAGDGDELPDRERRRRSPSGCARRRRGW